MATTETPIDQLKQLLQNLFKDDAEMKALEADPEGYFDDKGLPEVTAEQVDRCVAEMAPSYASSGHMAHANSSAAAASSPAAAAAAQVVQHHQTIVEQYGDFTYVDQSSETNVDNSVNISDLSADGDIDLDIDNANTTATEGGVAVGEDSDINGSVNTGEFSGIQGDGNTVDDLTFGDGNTSVEEVTNVDTAGGDATLLEGDGNTVTQVDVSGSEDTNIAMGDGNMQSADDIDNSLDIDNSVDNSINDSFDTEDSFNTDIDDHSTSVETNVQTDVNTDFGLL